MFRLGGFLSLFLLLLYFLSVPQEWDGRLGGAEAGIDPATLSALSAEASEWRTTQDGQRILTTTPSVLGGCRAQVYRAAGATQWYTAVIVGVNEHTGVRIAIMLTILIMLPWLMLILLDEVEKEVCQGG